MADSRFFRRAGSVALSEIASLTGAAVTSADNAPPDAGRVFSDVAPLDRAGADDISFLDNTKYVDAFAQSKAGACFVRPKFTSRAPKGMALLVTDEPYYAYALTAQKLYPEPEVTPGISPQAVVAGSANLGKGARIDSGAVIGEKVSIGDGCWIGANTVIGDNVEIGEGCRIGALCTISHAILGKRVLLHRGIHIGQDGFGFASGQLPLPPGEGRGEGSPHPTPSAPPSPKGRGIIKVPQLGRVIIGNDVEIGAGTCIDRGAGPDTIIGDGSKIDNLVQIGHNVQLGKYVIITGQCGIAGSTQVGDGVMLGAQSGLAGHLKIGPGARIAARTAQMHDVPAGETYCGVPGIPIKEFFRQVAVLAKLAKKE